MTAKIPLDDDGQINFSILADHLNAFVDTFLPKGAPSLTLSKMQAEILRDFLAPAWCMHSIKLVTFEQLAHLPMYANTLGGEVALREIALTRQAVQDIEHILSSLVMERPAIQPARFITFAKDPQTGVLAPMYNHMAAQQYAIELTKAWSQIPVFAEGTAN